MHKETVEQIIVLIDKKLEDEKSIFGGRSDAFGYIGQTLEELKEEILELQEKENAN